MSFKKKIITSHIKLITKMKVRNLLLASLAVAAMTACSNENDETVDNGQVQGTENAVIRLGISYPTVTRANTEDGLTEEQIFRTAKVIVNPSPTNATITIIISKLNNDFFFISMHLPYFY